MNKTISVWLIVEEGKNNGKVALQRRALGESFPFVCQATWSGGVENNEEPMDAVKRECCEEMGEKFCSEFNFLDLEFLTKTKFFRKSIQSNWECWHYTGKVSEKTIGLAKLHKEASPDFIFVGKNDEFFSLDDEKDTKNKIVLFGDQRDILKNLLNNNGD
jgi:hypothetical protein